MISVEHTFMVYAITYNGSHNVPLDICLEYAKSDYEYGDAFTLRYLEPMYIQNVLPKKAESLHDRE